jgi:DNA-binding LytR/AlgR family response regulator
MAKFFEFETEEKEGKIAVNVDQVTRVEPAGNGTTRIYTSDGIYIIVKEKFQSVLARLGQ